jgi:GAF domain-containing protein
MDKDKGVLKILSARGNEYKPKMEFRPNEGIAGCVFYSGNPEIINNVTLDKRFIRGINKISSIICAPLKIKDKTLGVINISSERPYEYTAADLKLLMTLVLQAASAIEIARLYDSERRHK